MRTRLWNALILIKHQYLRPVQLHYSNLRRNVKSENENWATVLRERKKLVAGYLLPTISSAHVPYTEIISTQTHSHTMTISTHRSVCFISVIWFRSFGRRTKISSESITAGTQTTKKWTELSKYVSGIPIYDRFRWRRKCAGDVEDLVRNE